MPHRTALLTTLLACLLATALPAVAGATTHVSIGDTSVAGRPLPGSVIYLPDDAETVHVELSQTATDLVVTATSAVALDVTAPCVGDSATVARCPLAVAKAFVLSGGDRPTAPVSVTASPGVTVDMVASGTPENADTLRGGAGDDDLEGASWDSLGALAADTIDGGAGDDQLFVGGAGTADGGPGDDIVQAREGDNQATLHGGDGADELWDAGTADGGAGDDKIVRTLEADGGAGNDVLLGAHHGTGGPGDDFLSSFGPGSALDGGDGNDSLSSIDPGTIAHGGPGNDHLDEGLGDNRGTVLAGDDGDDSFEGVGLGATLDGGPGNDNMSGRITGGPAPGRPGNTYLGGPGADRIDTRNVTADRIDCGDDVDTLFRDAADTATACENDPDGPHVPRVPTGPKVQTAIVPLAFRGTTHLTVTTKGTVHLAVRCPKGVTCAGRLRLTAGKVVLGAVTCAVKGDKTVTLKLNHAALKLLRKRKHHTLTATLSLTPGKLTAAPKPRRVTLRLPARH